MRFPTELVVVIGLGLWLVATGIAITLQVFKDFKDK